MSVAERIATTAACGKYQPEAFGAQCQRCYLLMQRQGAPVPPEISPAATMMVVAEAPGRLEVEHGRPLIGDSGQETMRALSVLGVNRNDVSWSHAILCRPPNNDLDSLLTRMKKENKARIAAGQMPYLSPVEACRPRFVQELRLQQDVLALGKVSLSAITGGNRSIMDVRGMPFTGILDGSGRFHGTAYFPHEGEVTMPLRVLPTIHPAFVLRQKRWRRVFRNDISRAVRWFRGVLRWQEPTRYYQPDPDMLEYLLLRQKYPFVAYDVETDAKEPLTARLRCVGFGTPEMGVVVGLLSVDGMTRLLPSDHEEAVIDVMRAHFVDPTIVKAGQNAGYYDRIVIERQLGVTPAPLVDTILLHRGVESELPHNLAFIGSCYTDVMDAWKADHTATEAQTDSALWEYNLTDAVVTARAVQPLYNIVQARGLLAPVTKHHEIQAACAGLHTTGMFIDQQRRREHDIRLATEAHHNRQLLRSIVDNDKFNPNSRAQVSEILFDQWGLTPDVIYASDPSAGKKLKKAFTSAGDPSTGDDHLRAMLMYVERDDQKTFLKALRKYRGVAKLRGTNIIPLRSYDEPHTGDELQINVDTQEGAEAVDEYDEATWEAQKKGPQRGRDKRTKEKKPGLVLSDGRVHPHYNAHATTSQRLSSSEPNGQNWSRKIRDIVCATMEGSYRSASGAFPEKFTRALIAADADQLELRFAAALAGAARYLEVFAKGGDPHAVTCEMLYGDQFRNASEADRKRLRDFAKRFSYAVLYRATVETVHETLASSENDFGDLVFPWLTMRETRVFYDRWLKANPEIETWWESDLAEYRAQGYLREPVFGWQRDFLDGEDPNEIANFKCQAGGSAIIHVAMERVLTVIPFGRWGPGTGLIQQGHDALMLEVPATHAPYEVQQRKDGTFKVNQWCAPKCRCITAESTHTLQECMTVDGRAYGLSVMFTSGAKAGFRWTDV